MSRYLLPLILAAQALVRMAYAEEKMPCVASEQALEILYGTVDATDVTWLKSCVVRHRYCVLTEDGSIATNVLQALKADGGIARFALIQVTTATDQACLAAIYSGGSAAAWMFGGWRTTGKIVEIPKFSATRLNSDSVAPSDLAQLMMKSYAKGATK